MISIILFMKIRTIQLKLCYNNEIKSIKAKVRFVFRQFINNCVIVPLVQIIGNTGNCFERLVSWSSGDSSLTNLEGFCTY